MSTHFWEAHLGLTLALHLANRFQRGQGTKWVLGLNSESVACKASTLLTIPELQPCQANLFHLTLSKATSFQTIPFHLIFSLLISCYNRMLSTCSMLRGHRKHKTLYPPSTSTVQGSHQARELSAFRAACWHHQCQAPGSSIL